MFKSSKLLPLVQAWNFIDVNIRKKLILISIINLLLSLLDLVGVAFIGVIGALGVYGVQSRAPGNRVSWFLQTLYLDDFELEKQVLIIASIATFFLVSKTIISIFLTRKINNFLSIQAAEISIKLMRESYLQYNKYMFHKLDSQDKLFTVGTGVNSLLNGVVGSFLALIADLFLIIILLFGLFITSPLLSLVSLVYFGTILIILYKLLRHKASEIGNQNRIRTILFNQKYLDLISIESYLVPSGGVSRVLGGIEKARKDLAVSSAQLYFIPNISKYVLEGATIVGALLVSLIQFATLDATKAAATLGIFIVSASRITPALLRFQNNAINLRIANANSSKTLELIKDLRFANSEIYETKINQEPFAVLSVQNVSFKHSNNHSFELKNISLDIFKGEKIAFTGPSGVGKSSLFNLILGLSSPDNGKVLINGNEPLTYFANNPNKVSYAPQKVHIIRGSLLENIALRQDISEFDENKVLKLIHNVGLIELLQTLPNGIQSKIGEGEHLISGGEAQKVGLARALFSSPDLLLLDEFTSSLDEISELKIINYLNSLQITILFITHRTSTLKIANKIYKLSNGTLHLVENYRNEF